MVRTPSEQLDLFNPDADDAAPAATRRAGRRRARRAAGGGVPFTYSVGVGAFGWLRGPRVSRLCETRLFEGGAGAERATLIALDDGSTVLAAADGSLAWERREPEDACALVGMPPPELKRFKSFARRLDVHHVERHRSALWQLLVATVSTHALPCGYGLTAAAERRTALTGVGLIDEDPEVFASAIAVRVAEGAEPFAAVLDELAADARLGGQTVELAELLHRTGWSAVLPMLELRIAELGASAGQRDGAVGSTA